MKRVFFRFMVPVLFTLFCSQVFCQFFSPLHYPKNYFGWPVQAPVAIVANFGELRANHYHMGLDCRTNQKENLRVLASAEGYIAKVKIEPFGFGRCLYINHPNGLTSLYAHLNAFEPALEKYVTEQQYLLQSWNVFLDVPPGLFKVHKGDFIAYSGNSGGSQGPHVHFEIRDTKTDKVLNPLLFNFPIPDNIPPTIYRLAVYDRSKSTYEQSPRLYPLKKVNGVYVPANGRIVVNQGKVSFAITSFDRYTGSTNQNGIYEAFIYDNDNMVSGFRLDSVSYNETRFLNAHIDYKFKSNGGPYLQHLSRLPGYTNGIYLQTPTDGVIQVEAGESRHVRIEVSDPNNNRSVIRFTVEAINEQSKRSMPVSNTAFLPGNINVFENDKLRFYLPENALYDSFYFQYNEMPSASGNTIYQLHNPSVPLHVYFPVSIRESFLQGDTGKIVMKRSYRNKEDYKKAVLINGWYKASFREFGNYQLMIDDIPPTVTPIGFRDGMNMARSRRILFTVKDNTEEISKFIALLDGKWLRFTNDKGRNFIYNFDEYCPPGSHQLRVIVEDQVGNRTEKFFNFTR